MTRAEKIHTLVVRLHVDGDMSGTIDVHKHLCGYQEGDTFVLTFNAEPEATYSMNATMVNKSSDAF